MASSRHGAQPANSQREGMFCAITHTERFAIIITYSAILYERGKKYDSVIAIIGLFFLVLPTKLTKRQCFNFKDFLKLFKINLSIIGQLHCRIISIRDLTEYGCFTSNIFGHNVYRYEMEVHYAFFNQA